MTDKSLSERARDLAGELRSRPAGYLATWRNLDCADLISALAQENDELRRRTRDGLCTREPFGGDCEHMIGLPGKSIPGQHDGPDDTVDAYGKPNGWCWSCWRGHQLDELRAENEQLKESRDHADIAKAAWKNMKPK